MPSNIEIKACVKSLAPLRVLAEGLADQPCEIMYQEDVFFHAKSGRLKLRIFSESYGELIHYERPDTQSAKQSQYLIHATSEPFKLRRLLADALGETIVVKKTRELYRVGQTRIHLDDVEDLGTFMELEVVLRPGQTVESGRSIADELMEKLGVHESDLVSCAYADLLRNHADPVMP